MRALLVAVLALAACAQPQHETPAPAPAPSGASASSERIRADSARLEAELRAPGVVVAGIGQTANLGEGLTVRPVAIKEDSRCPLDVACVWAGRLVLRAMVSGSERELTLGEPLATPNGVVVFAVAAPSKWNQWPAEAGPRPSYRFGFRRG